MGGKEAAQLADLDGPAPRCPSTGRTHSPGAAICRLSGFSKGRELWVYVRQSAKARKTHWYQGIRHRGQRRAVDSAGAVRSFPPFLQKKTERMGRGVNYRFF